MRSFWPAAILAQLCALTQSTIIPRSDCTAIQVQTGEYCDALAQKCGITGNQFTTYNPQPNLCSDLVVGQWVCCSSGTLPDMKPKPSSNGTCYKHTAVSGENCASIGAPLSLTIDDINNFNNNTWGWDGCENLEADQTFCLSTGNPPMPATVPAAVCGPQVNGTQQPADMDNLASLNPCPLNACCNKWGQCGITAEFCTVSKSSTGAPGTSAPGQNGCISNCGMDIVSGSGGGSGRTVGYFEAFNTARECLNMDASQLAGLGYDTVHFGFGELTNDFKPNVTGSADQFATFKTTSGFKKVVSFGGWAFSTDPSTYNVFRTAVTAENRDAFAQNIADFLNTNGMDGVDFDWEYPGAPDIPGIPPGNKDDGDNYLAFLKSLRSVIGSGQTISIAAPASYWYLKQFPIANISQVVDYIVFMTYDLHGQWDYGNKFADEGCPTGGCLRSHVNLTETDQALAMITKAGVDASKIVVGVASYGRSFKMVDPSCTGPNCQFTGPQSGATPGECTNTAGYISNAEISQIQSNDSSAHAWYDQGSDSNIMTYGDGNWVAYMDQNTLKSRSSHYAGYSFAGTVEWAVDLAQWWPAVFEVNGHKVDGTIPVVGKAQKLNSGATCDDLSNWAKANIPENKGNATTTNADMWLESGTDAYFNKWITTVWNELPPAPQSEPNQFSGTFMKIPDLENSWDSCKVENLCKNIDCEENRAANFGDATGEDYMIIVSMYNVANALSTIYQAVEAAYTNWAAMQSIWVYNFDPTTPSPSTVGTKEALNAVAAVVGIAAALLTLPTFGASDAALAAAGAGAAIAGGVSGAVANGLPTATDTTFATLSDFAEYMKKQVDSAMTSIDGLYTGLKDNGNSNGLSYQTMFQNGAWVDETAIGLDAANTTVINNTFEDYINAIALNWAWSHQRVWLMSYPMTQEEYDTTTWYSGNGDSRLRAYYGGRGFFFMSVFPQQNGAYYIPRVQDPPGWGNLTDLGIDLNDVILGSANSYNAGGYGYSITDPAAMFSDPSFDPTTFSMKTPGIFTIPVCALDSSYGWTPTVADFADALAGPGALHNDNDNGDYSPLCWCLRVADSTGKWFDSFVDVGGWEGGSNPQCPPNNQYNTPGGQMYKGSNR